MRLWCLIVFTILGGTLGFQYNARYKFLQTLLISDAGLDLSRYQIKANTLIEQVHPEILRVQLNDLKLLIHRKNSLPGNYEQIKSKFDSADNHNFFIEIHEGIIKHIYVANTEEPYIVNLKRSVASLLQFQTKEGEYIETDVSGSCRTKYSSANSIIKKNKIECQPIFPNLNNGIWGGSISPHRITEISLSGDKLEFIKSKEDYHVKLSITDVIDTIVSTHISLTFDQVQGQNKIKEGETIEKLISEAEKKLGVEYIVYSLLPDGSQELDSEDVQIESIIKENTKFLTNKKLGTINSAMAALKVMKSIHKMSYIDVLNMLQQKNNKKIIEQLLDMLGAVQTLDSHKAVMTFLKMDSKEYNLNLCERYLWALSTSIYPKKAVVYDLLSLSKNEIADDKLRETLMQTISSLVRKLEYEEDDELHEKTVKHFSTKLTSCNKTDDLCHRIYLKALTNIRSPKALNLLIDYVLTGSKSVGVRAMKALQALGKDHWNSDVMKVAERVYLSNGTFDSSAKIIALDILLESNKPSSYSKLLQLFKNQNSSYELKEYLLQRLAQVSEKNPELRSLIKSALVSEGLNHYNTLAQGGLSTAFDRRFMSNGYLSTAQEVKSGLLKQGYVHINLEERNVPNTIFTLGLFSNGLSSFVSDGSDDDSDEVNAGLELSVLGVELRPFIFFDGHGELMGHVFSGAGSTLSPAYQAIFLLNNEVAHVPLGTGELLSVQLSTVASVDLSGKIEISLWSRTAESLVQNSAALVTEQIITVGSPYFKSQTKVQLTAEPQLKLTSDIQFSSNVALCLQLEQPQISVQCNSTTVINADNKFKSKKFINRNIIVPGKTYALNSKNNEMCRILYS